MGHGSHIIKRFEPMGIFIEAFRVDGEFDYMNSYIGAFYTSL